jgi:hypothetical protein
MLLRACTGIVADCQGQSKRSGNTNKRGPANPHRSNRLSHGSFIG